MTIANQIIRDALVRYMTSPVAPLFAVMVKGKWGSGKTWLVDAVVNDLRKNGQKILWVSLYGLQSRDEIDDELFKQLHPLLASKGAVVAGRTLKSAAKFFHIEVPDLDLSKFVSGAVDHVLVFDDLERCEVPLPALLGYINAFVEHGKQRVVLISNEEEVPENVRSEYLRVREKLIGRTFEVHSNVDEALDLFATELRVAGADDLIGRHKDLIRNVYRSSGHENLRNLRSALLGFDDLMANVDRRYRNCRPIVADVLTQFLVLTFELRSATLTTADVLHMTRTLSLAFHTKEPERTDLQRVLVAIDEKYIGIDWNNESLPNHLWSRMFNTGIVDTAAVNDALASSRHLADNSLPSWRRLWHFFELTDEGFAESLAGTLSDMAALKYTNPGVLKHVVATLLELSKLGLYKPNAQSIIDTATERLDRLVEGRTFEVSAREESFGMYWNSGWEGLGYHGADSTEFKAFSALLEKRAGEVRLQRRPAQAKELVGLLAVDPSKFARSLILSNSEECVYFDVPILADADPLEFVSNFELTSGTSVRTIGVALRERYQPSRLEALLPERRWLLRVARILRASAGLGTGSVSAYQARQLASGMRTAAKLLRGADRAAQQN